MENDNNIINGEQNTNEQPNVGNPTENGFAEPIAQAFEPTTSEPTVTFDAVHQQKASSVGIKVFFAMLAVVVLLIAAVAVGYVFGKSDYFTPQNNMQVKIQSKEDVEAVDSITVYNNLSPSVVNIYIYNSKSSASASGVVYTEDGYIVTNDHIYSDIDSPRFLVVFADGTEYDAAFVAGDTRSDLAVLKIEAKGLKPATFGVYEELVTGEQVVAIGYPSGAGVEAIFTSGTISSKGIRVRGTSSYTTKMIQTDTPINPGNSGGALVNMYSQVVGITSAKLAGSQYDSVGYAIPSNTVIKVVDSLIENGYVKGRGKLGITYTEINTVISKIEGLPTGLQIAEVTPNSDLYGKGIEKDDIITHINDVEIKRADIALDIIDATEPGETMSFTVYDPETKTPKTVYGVLILDEGNSSYKTSLSEK